MVELSSKEKGKENRESPKVICEDTLLLMCLSFVGEVG